MIKHIKKDCLFAWYVPCINEELATIIHSNIVPLATSLREDLNKIDNDNLRKILAKGAKYREPQSINWKYNFQLLIDYGGLCQKIDKERKRGGWNFFRMGQSYYVVYSNSNRKTQKVNEHKRNICFQWSHCCNVYDKYVVVPADRAPNNIARRIRMIIKDRIRFG